MIETNFCITIDPKFEDFLKNFLEIMFSSMWRKSPKQKLYYSRNLMEASSSSPLLTDQSDLSFFRSVTDDPDRKRRNLLEASSSRNLWRNPVEAGVQPPAAPRCFDGLNESSQNTKHHRFHQSAAPRGPRQRDEKIKTHSSENWFLMGRTEHRRTRDVFGASSCRTQWPEPQVPTQLNFN